MAVNLQLDHPLRIDRVFRLSCADQPFQARVVDLAGQAKPRVGRSPAGGQLGVEQVIMCIADRIQEPVDRLGAAPAVLLQAVDPGELGKRIDKLGIRILAPTFSRLRRTLFTFLCRR